MELKNIIFLSLLFSCLLASDPETVAESSDYTRTSSYQEVIDFIHQLQKTSPNLRVETMCRSTEGREIPLMVIGDPLPASPKDLKYGHRLVVYLQANIHAGEIEGKEAVLMLARDILQQDSDGYLKDIVILIAPIFNADGNEKFSTENRKTQNGPPSVGVRHNSQQLDLNRDAVKIESPEMEGLITNVLNKWDPALVIDCHTTNGSKHEEPVTFVWGNNPNGDVGLIDFTWSEFRPFIKKNMQEKFDILSVEYGHFTDYNNPGTGWQSLGAEIRYVVNYVGLRNRLSLLLENYTYADYKTRVKGTYAFLHSSLKFCQNNKVKIQELVRQADLATMSKGMEAADSFIVEYETVPYDEKITLKGYEMTVVPRDNYPWPRIEYDLDNPKDYVMPYYCKVIAKRSVKYPAGYLLDVHDPAIVRKLQQHGIVVERLYNDADLRVEEFVLREVKSAEKLFQGHNLTTIKGNYQTVERTFAKGVYYVSTQQLRGNLAAYLLEPECNDGLITWNFFDNYLVRQWRGLGRYPVYKIHQPAPIVKRVVNQLK